MGKAKNDTANETANRNYCNFAIENEKNKNGHSRKNKRHKILNIFK